MTVMFAGKSRIVIGDSLLRHLKQEDIKDSVVVARPGKTFKTITNELMQGKIDISGYQVVALVIGTNV